jgi:hypothetical protein
LYKRFKISLNNPHCLCPEIPDSIQLTSFVFRLAYLPAVSTPYARFLPKRAGNHTPRAVARNNPANTSPSQAELKLFFRLGMKGRALIWSETIHKIIKVNLYSIVSKVAGLFVEK